MVLLFLKNMSIKGYLNSSKEKVMKNGFISHNFLFLPRWLKDKIWLPSLIL